MTCRSPWSETLKELVIRSFRQVFASLLLGLGLVRFVVYEQTAIANIIHPVQFPAAGGVFPGLTLDYASVDFV